ncbi:MAG: hypothetical protein NTW29_00145 [Bacteroidetes bacterium]|nr:hypothetical protein [Bacteroidota bacterium]
MKKVVFIAILLTTRVAILSGQLPSWLLWNRPRDDYEYLVSVSNTPLFNKEEIKQRGIKSCTVLLNVPKDKYIKKGFTDSVAIFRFDEAGNTCFAVTKSRNSGNHPIRWDTIIGKHWREPKGDSSASVTSYRRGRKIVMTYYFMAYKPGSAIADTTTIRKEVFDKKNQLLEIKDKLTRNYYNYLCRNFCCDQPQLHAIMRYDKHNNITLYREPDSPYYTKFRYKPSERIVYTYNTGTNKLKEKQIIPVSINADSIVEKRKETLSLYRLEKNSRLFRLMKNDLNHIDFGVREYIFRYNYREEKAPLKN